MKKTKLSLLFFLLFILLLPSQVFAGNFLRVSAGVGMPELPSVSLRGIMGNTELGFTAGKLIEDKNQYSVAYSVDLYRYFRTESAKPKDDSWFGRFSVTYLKDETSRTSREYVFLSPRMGREITLTDNFGLELDGGFLYRVYHTKKDKIQSSCGLNFDLDYKFLPTAGIRFYYKY